MVNWMMDGIKVFPKILTDYKNVLRQLVSLHVEKNAQMILNSFISQSRLTMFFMLISIVPI